MQKEIKEVASAISKYNAFEVKQGNWSGLFLGFEYDEKKDYLALYTDRVMPAVFSLFNDNPRWGLEWLLIDGNHIKIKRNNQALIEILCSCDMDRCDNTIDVSTVENKGTFLIPELVDYDLSGVYNSTNYLVIDLFRIKEKNNIAKLIHKYGTDNKNKVAEDIYTLKTIAYKQIGCCQYEMVMWDILNQKEIN